jgi:hypothetical protein
MAKFLTCKNTHVTLSFHSLLIADKKKLPAKAVQNVSASSSQLSQTLCEITKKNLFNVANLLSAKKLDEQCFYDLTCLHYDENSVCLQINHNAICSCKEGYHAVTHSKPTRRTFCTEGINYPAKVFYGISSDFLNH